MFSNARALEILGTVEAWRFLARTEETYGNSIRCSPCSHRGFDKEQISSTAVAFIKIAS